ncbi:MAG: primosomal protein N' [Clostridia bacterium]|nr:primosomal protein N' [Clostridia bacterium]
MYTKVILTQNNKAIDMAFTYKVPESMLENLRIGSRVIVPFGVGNRLIEGFVLELSELTEFEEPKDIYQIIEGFSLTELQIQCVKWLKETYLATYDEALSTIIPSGIKLNKTEYYTLIKPFEANSKQQVLLKDYLNEPVTDVILNDLQLMNTARALVHKGYIKKEVVFKQEIDTQYKKVAYGLIEEGQLEDALSKISSRASKLRQILSFIIEVKQCDVNILNRELKATASQLSKLEALGFIEVKEQEKFRQPDQVKQLFKTEKFSLSHAQNEVYEKIKFHLNQHKKFLIHGVTGSGKTEIYMTLAEEVVKQGKQVIILVPEIALTPQIVKKFIKRFGSDIAIMHSKVSQGERYDQYRAILSGEINIIIGARSAVFSPCENLGLIIIDEEHENSYKSESNPKYVTEEVATYLTEKAGVPLVVASATPSISTYYKKDEDFELLSLNTRFNQHPLPEIHLVDMREELNNGNRSMFSVLLLDKIQERLEKKEQTILFYNRKGYATFVSCRNCGYALKCPNCDIALTYHQQNNEAKCSYCDYKIQVSKTCPECDSGYFKFFGTGTEKVEDLIQEVFPEARIGRLDSESTSRKGSLESIIEDMEQQKIDILLGTQMVTKGLDFKNVTLVGALSADLSLNMPDYLAPEKTFQLLTQVAGRAGRGDKKGEVVIQTYTPDHYAIESAIHHDYKQFAEMELAIREAYGYPPFMEMVSIIITGEKEEQVIPSAHNLYRELERFIYKRLNKEQVQILGPNPALFQRINSRYRWQIILKFDKMDLVLIRNIINYICIKHRDQVVMPDVYMNINIRPLSLL